MARSVLRSLLVTLALASSLATPAAAGVLRLSGVALATDADVERRAQGRFNPGHGMIFDYDERLSLDSGSSEAVALSWEERFGERWGIALAVATAEVDLDFETRVTLDPSLPSGDQVSLGPYARVDVLPLLVDLRYHLLDGPRLDLYAGVTAGYVFADDPELAPISGVFSFLPLEDPARADDAFAWGAHLGFDVKLGDDDARLFALVRYLDAEIDVGVIRGPGELELGPLAVELGVGKRF